MRSPRTTMKSSPQLSQLEKALAQQQKPNAAKTKNKQKNKWKGKAIACSKDNSINVILPGAILKYGRYLCEFLHICFHFHQARNYTVWQIIIYGWLLTQSSVKDDKEGKTRGIMRERDHYHVSKILL